MDYERPLQKVEQRLVCTNDPLGLRPRRKLRWTRLKAVGRVLWRFPGALLCAAELHDWRYRSTIQGREWPWWHKSGYDTIRRCARCHAFSTKNDDGTWRQVW